LNLGFRALFDIKDFLANLFLLDSLVSFSRISKWTRTLSWLAVAAGAAMSWSFMWSFLTPNFTAGDDKQRHSVIAPSTRSIPGPRSGHEIAFHAWTGSLVMFGGHDGEILLNETWIWNNGPWERRDLVNPPPPRTHFALCQSPGKADVVLDIGIAREACDAPLPIKPQATPVGE